MGMGGGMPVLDDEGGEAAEACNHAWDIWVEISLYLEGGGEGGTNRAGPRTRRSRCLVAGFWLFPRSVL